MYVNSRLKRALIEVTGLVQGVFFRESVKRIADELNITGWVRNEINGLVKILAEGTEENLQKLIEWCKKGTEWAKVEKIKIEREEAKEEFTSFEIH